MEDKGIEPTESSFCLTALSLAECISYIFASLLGDKFFKGRLLLVNLVAAALLAVTCVLWTLLDVSYTAIVVLCTSMLSPN